MLLTYWIYVQVQHIYCETNSYKQMFCSDSNEPAAVSCIAVWLISVSLDPSIWVSVAFNCALFFFLHLLFYYWCAAMVTLSFFTADVTLGWELITWFLHIEENKHLIIIYIILFVFCKANVHSQRLKPLGSSWSKVCSAEGSVVFSAVCDQVGALTEGFTTHFTHMGLLSWT